MPIRTSSCVPACVPWLRATRFTPKRRARRAPGAKDTMHDSQPRVAPMVGPFCEETYKKQTHWQNGPENLQKNTAFFVFCQKDTQIKGYTYFFRDYSRGNIDFFFGRHSKYQCFGEVKIALSPCKIGQIRHFCKQRGENGASPRRRFCLTFEGSQILHRSFAPSF